MYIESVCKKSVSEKSTLRKLVYRKIIQYLFATILCAASSWVTAAVREYHLHVDEQIINITGKPVKKITVNGQFPAPVLEFEEGDEAVIHVHNQLKDQETSIHWHGLLLPGLMDGVPGFNQFKAIPPKGYFQYRFKIRQNGTYWYHAHSKGQEQDGLYGSFIVYPKGKLPVAAHEQTAHDYVIMLSDFHLTNGDQIMKNLKKSAEYYQNQRETIFDVFKQVQRDGLKATWQDRAMWNQMRMLKTDLSDVTGYTFLVNGKTPEQNWTGNFKANEKVRLRFINASAMSFFDVRIPNLKMTIVSADGQPVKPVDVDEFRIGAAETYDVIVQPTAQHYQIEAESIDRSGFAIASLQQQGVQPARVQMPQSRPRALLTMEDMGHGHAGGQHQHTSQNSEAVTSEHDHHHMNHTEMNHEEMGHTTEQHQAMLSMHNEDHVTASRNPQLADEHAAHQGTSHQTISSQGAVSQQSSDQKSLSQNQVQPVYGWANAATPEGYKALQYSDLKSLSSQIDLRAPEREIEIRLGGVMERYIWTMNGQKFNQATPINVAYGERIRLTFVNDSMMAHPMHLHGMFMQLENGQDMADLPNKHTVIVPPGKSVSLLLTADELGEWAIHCHLLYHMSAGMMNKMIVAKVDEQSIVPQHSQHGQIQQKQQENHHAHH